MKRGPSGWPEFCLGLIAISLASPCDAAHYTNFDPAGSTWTAPYGINTSGIVVGEYTVSPKRSHGFVRAADGSITSFDAPSAIFTTPLAISDGGPICGEYTTRHRNYNHSFVRDPDGTVTEFDPPHALGSIAVGFDGNGNIAGTLDGHDLPKVSGYIRGTNGSSPRSTTRMRWRRRSYRSTRPER